MVKSTLKFKSIFFLLVILMVTGLACQTITKVFTPPTEPVSPPQAPGVTEQSPLEPAPTEHSQSDDGDDLPVEPVPSPTPLPTPTPTHVPVSETEQLDIFEELWQIIEDEYLYADFNGVDWDAAYDQFRAEIEGGLDTETFYLKMDEMVWNLGDEHSVFLNPRQVAEEEAEYAGDNNYVGIGIWVQYNAERERAVILLVFPNSPAEQVGLRSHDSILAVEGVPMGTEDGEVLDTLLGIEGTEVIITVQTPGEEPRDLTIRRARISGGLPVPYETLSTSDGKRIGYMIVPTFGDSTIGAQVGDALSALTDHGPLDGLILDNRINGGGWDNVMGATLSYFVDGLVGHFVNRGGQYPMQVSLKDIGGSGDVPLVVLVGEETISFGEVFAGVLKDQGRATLIGETTLGNVEILWGYDFDDGSRAWIAHDTFRPVNNPDVNWEQDGIVPDIVAPAEWDMYTTQTDPAVQAALDFFDGP